MISFILKIFVTSVFAVMAIDSKLKNDIGQAVYYMLWVLFVAVVFNA